MVREGLLSNQEWGVWALTESGWSAARGDQRIAPNDAQSIDASWDLDPGDDLNRADRAELYGGAEQGGIQPSTTSPNVFVYTDPSAGELYGYTYDGWDSQEDLFLYTGEGRVGDQRLRAGNKAVAQHVQDGKALRLFVADGFETGTRTKRQVYLGEFEVDRDLPFVRAEAPDTEGVLRSVLVFRLHPIGRVLRRESERSETGDAPASTEAVLDDTPLRTPPLGAEVGTETTTNPTFTITPAAAVEGVRREALLSDRFQAFLEFHGRTVRRYRVKPAGSLSTLLTDLYDVTASVLYEAKAASTRECVRMAIGQLLDYRRFVPPASRLALLVPTPPALDLIDLLEDLNIDLVVEPTTSNFEWVCGSL
jgi:5-methylcytosine-specific restriction protein A